MPQPEPRCSPCSWPTLIQRRQDTRHPPISPLKCRSERSRLAGRCEPSSALRR
jgi:hypothetical protein